MALKKEKKQEIVKGLKENMKKQKTAVFVAFKGIKAKDVFSLREQLKKDKCLLEVVKKTLLDIVLKENGIDIGKKKFQGETALIFGFEDEVAPARIAHQFSLKNVNLKILGGIFQNKFAEREEILTLAKLPSKQELYTKVVGTINAPVSGFVNVLQGNIRGLVYILSSIKK